MLATCGPRSSVMPAACLLLAWTPPLPEAVHWLPDSKDLPRPHRISWSCQLPVQSLDIRSRLGTHPILSLSRSHKINYITSDKANPALLVCLVVYELLCQEKAQQ